MPANGKSINVDALARVEGEGGLTVKLRGAGQVADVKLRIYEPPRFFEAFLRGRHFTEPPDITARICGICPVAYQMSAVQALEAACGVKVTPAIRALRRLLYCGEWIESHALHVYLLHAPDFLGYQDAIQMAKAHPQVVEQALAVKKAGNDVVALVGGREIHPINARVGGFYKAPTASALRALVEPLERALGLVQGHLQWLATLSFPEFERDYEFVALRHPTEYPLNEGRLVSNKGLDIPASEFNRHFVEEHVAHSNALQVRRKNGGAYHVGPLARYNLNFDRLSPAAQEAARKAGLQPVCRNPFKSLLVRGVELIYALEESLRLIRAYEPPVPAAVEVRPRAGEGHGCTEAPRGILYHRYRIHSNGTVQEAQIVPPTAQNQKVIEEDLRAFIPSRVHLPHDRLTWECEQAIRNYDPCISCATHFLRLTIERES